MRNLLGNRIFLKHRSVALRSVWILWDMKFSTKSWYAKKKIGKRSFLKHSRLPLKTVLGLWDKKDSAQNRDTPLFIYKSFGNRNKIWNTGGFISEKLRSVRQMFFEKQPWHSVLSINFFHTGSFLKHCRVYLRTVSVLWDKFVICKTKFWNKKTPEHRMDPLLFNLVLRNKTFSTKSWYPS